MIRRLLVMLAACALFSGACLALAGRSREAYPMMAASGAMSKEEVDACLGQAGVHVERFAGEVPFRHLLRVEIEEYRQGRAPRPLLSGATLVGAAGLHRLLLLGKESPEGIALSAAYLGTVEDGYGAAEASRPARLGALSDVRWERPRGSGLALGRRVELCRAYREDGTGSTAAGSLEDAVARHGTVVAVFVTLERL